MKKIVVILLTLCVVIFPSFAKDKNESFDTKSAMSYVEDLAADAMMGRKSGQPGGVMAEDYVASKFREWGLEQAGNHETYFQNLTLQHSHVAEGVVLEIITGRERRNFYYGEDWKVQNLSGAGNSTAELVFVGYGIHAPEKGYDDYAGVDVKGKLVLFSRETPSELAGKFNKEATLQNRIKTAQEFGALGVLLFKREPVRRRYYRFRLQKELHKPDFVILSVEEKVMNFIFKDLKVTLPYLFREIEKRSKSMSFETGIKAFFSVNATFDAERPTRNVLAKISGTDALLKDECVIIGAHMDHMGIHPLGDVMNGANDNASGTAVILEIARIMKLNQAKPKRTVIFALWAGEEQGLFGSRYYMDHPTLPIEKTVAYINLDMVGVGNGKVPFEGIYYAPRIWDVLKEKLPQDILDYVSPGRGGPRGSDHAAFMMAGVPGFFISTTPYTAMRYIRYHHSRDDVDLINPDMLKKTGDFVHMAVKILASESGDLLQPLRKETFYLRHRNLMNFEMSPLDRFLEHHKDARDSHVDLQLSLIEEKKELSGDELRVDILKTILSSTEKIKKAEGLTFYSESAKLSRDIRLGKTTVLVGLRGIKSLMDDPRWAQVLVRQGISFIFVDDPSSLFEEGELTKEGEEIIHATNNNGLLLLFEGLNSSQEISLLNVTQKPVVLFSRYLPDKEVQELLKKKKSAWGLVLGEADEPLAYFKKLDEAKKAIGSEHLLIVNSQCLWGKEGKEQMLKVLSEILKAKYGRSDIPNLLSEAFLKVLRKVRGEGEPEVFGYVPF